jgi:ribonuclease P protein component
LKQFSLSARERLKSRKQIGLVFNEGRHINLPPLRISWLVDQGQTDEPLQIGVGASGRHFKKAVDRNRIKRFLREAWRLQKMPLKEMLLRDQKKLSVFIIYTGRDLPDMDIIMSKVRESIEKLMQVFNANHTKDS